IAGMQKSWEGSLTMTMVSFWVILLILGSVQGFHWQIGLIAIAVSLVATALESFSKFGIDNLTVPLGSAMLAFLLNQLFI
ncbi:MAG: phosphatidate cytidylyltransferase, partial [Snowella sp.]